MQTFNALMHNAWLHKTPFLLESDLNGQSDSRIIGWVAVTSAKLLVNYTDPRPLLLGIAYSCLMLWPLLNAVPEIKEFWGGSQSPPRPGWVLGQSQYHPWWNGHLLGRCTSRDAETLCWRSWEHGAKLQLWKNHEHFIHGFRDPTRREW